MNKKTLVLGASTNPMRYSNLAIQKLLVGGIEVRAIGNRIGEVAGVELNNSKVQFENIHTITLYLGEKN